MHGTRAAASDEDEVARITSLAEGHVAQRVGHVAVHDLEDAQRRTLDAYAQRLRHLTLNGLAASSARELECPPSKPSGLI